jgi:hypothetical protein
MKGLLVICMFLMAQVARADALGDEVARLKIKLPEGKSLTSNELRQVVQLAHRGGLRAVTEIQPTGGQSGDVGLNMHSKPVVNGRFATETILTIWPKSWQADRSKSLPSYASNIGLGNFLFGQSGKWTREQATFVFNGKTNHLDCSGKTTNLAEADQVLDALMNGRIDFKDDAVKERFKNINVNSIHSIQAKDKSFGMGFNTRDPFCWINILGELKGNRIVIGLVQEICA